MADSRWQVAGRSVGNPIDMPAFLGTMKADSKMQEKVHYPLRLQQQQKPPLTELGGFAFAMLREDDRDRLSLRRRCRVAAHGEVRSVALG